MCVFAEKYKQTGERSLSINWDWERGLYKLYKYTINYMHDSQGESGSFLGLRRRMGVGKEGSRGLGWPLRGKEVSFFLTLFSK